MELFNIPINRVPVTEHLNSNANELINQHSPLLNLVANPGAINVVGQLRSKCKDISRGNLKA